jgi:hypothetical protein
VDRNVDPLDDAIARLICILELRSRYARSHSDSRDAFQEVFGAASNDRLRAIEEFLNDLGVQAAPVPKTSDIRCALKKKPGLRTCLLELFDTCPFCLDLAEDVLAVRAGRNRSSLAEFNTEIERIEKDFEKDELKATCEDESLTDRLALLFYLNEDLAQRVASVRQVPFPFPLVLGREMDCVTTSRYLREGYERDIKGYSGWERARNADLIGLALSGGGIRSATFNLGILQGLAEVRVRPDDETGDCPDAHQEPPAQVAEKQPAQSDEKPLLQLVDYLSTVSGGGYIGSWLHAWILRSDESAVGDCLRDGCHQRGIEQVISNLSPTACPDPQSDPQQPIKFLRRYAKYLTPETGVFSADTWTVAAIWLRNTLLNLIILAFGLGASLLVPRILHGPFAFLAETGWAAAFTAGFLLAAGIVAGINLSSFDDRERRRDRIVYQQKGVQIFFILPLFFAAFSMSAWFGHLSGQPRVLETDWGIYVWIGGVCAALSFLSSVIGRYYDCWYNNSGSIGSQVWPWVGLVAASVLTGALAGAVAYFAANVWVWWAGMHHDWFMMMFGPPLAMAFFSLPSIVHIGLLGSNFPDDRREWWGRAGAYIILYGLGWIVLCLLALWGPWFVAWVGDSSPVYRITNGSGLTLTWLLSTVSGVLAGHSKKTGHNSGADGNTANPLLQGVALVTPYVFIFGLLIWLSFGIHWLTLQSPYRARRPEVTDYSTLTEKEKKLWCEAWPKQQKKLDCQFDEAEDRRVGWGTGILRDGEYPQPPVAGSPGPLSRGTGELPSWTVLSNFHVQYLSIVRWWWALIAAVVSFGIAFVLAWRVNVNEFSMHHFYRNRLVRCYLGASLKKRRPNRFTGLDPDDDRCLGDLTPKTDATLPGIRTPTKAQPRYSGPYAIVNATLNLVQGDELAWQERKGQSFVFTPEFCGYAASYTEEVNTEHADHPKIARYGFRPTRTYAYPDSGIHIGSVMAISGAAQSPNEGYNTSPANAFLMTVFNVRLGWWISNTRHRNAWKKASPAWGLFYLLQELLASTNNKSPFLYLSDGGHFENLGIYELVRRRCRYIIACDASQDGDLCFEDLGNAIRKCRTDFGAEIKIGVDSLKKSAETGHSRAHCVLGIIQYADGTTGDLLYIKPTLTGDEPSDVVEYRTAHSDFPHDSTLNQFFTESQFESYRTLGYHIVRNVFSESRFREQPGGNTNGKHKLPANGGKRARQGLDELFDELRQRWYPSSKPNEKSFTRFAEKFDELYERLRKDQRLKGLDREFYPDIENFPPPPTATAGHEAPFDVEPNVFRSRFYFCTSLVQLMEEVYLDLKLEDHYDHPDNQGWISTFHRWTGSPTFRLTWHINSSLFGTRFRSFLKERFRLDTGCLTLAPCKREDLPSAFSAGSSKVPPALARDAGWFLIVLENDPYEVNPFPSIPVGFGLVKLKDEAIPPNDIHQLVYIWIAQPWRRMGFAGRVVECFADKYADLTMARSMHSTESGSIAAYRALRTRLEVKQAENKELEKSRG